MSLSAQPASESVVAEGGVAFAAFDGGGFSPSFDDAPVAAATRGVCRVELNLRHAGRRRVRIAWECVGAANAPVLVVQGGISATRHVASSAAHPESGWWESQRAVFDPDAFRVVSIDWLGADGVLDCTLDPSDQADAIAAVLDALGIARVHAFVGASYGAMVGLQFAARHAARLGRLVAISGAHRSHPQATAFRVIQRRIVRLGRNQAAVREALALARALAVIGYRSAAEFDARFDAAPTITGDTTRFAVEDYFDAIGPRFVARFTPNAYLRLSESIDLQQVNPAQVSVPTELVAVQQDQIVPPTDVYALAEGLGAGCRVHRIDSVYGHDAFLKEVDAIGLILRNALATGVAA